MDDSEIENIKANVNKILNSLGWTEESLFEEETKVQCPVDANHLIAKSSLAAHVEVCKYLKQGYTREEIKKLPPCSRFSYSEDASSFVTLDKELLYKITSGIPVSGNNPGCSGYITSIAKASRNVPLTYDQYTVEFSPQERLAIHDYIANKGREIIKQRELKLEDLLFDFERKDDKANKPKSHLEILAEQRDYKRRRPTYRAKNVHITKKSYTEVMKEVIENQMVYLIESEKQHRPSSSKSESQENSHENYAKVASEENENEPKVKEEIEGHKSEKHKKGHHKRKRSRSRSRERHRHKSSSHSKDKKHRKHH